MFDVEIPESIAGKLNKMVLSALEVFRRKGIVAINIDDGRESYEASVYLESIMKACGHEFIEQSHRIILISSELLN